MTSPPNTGVLLDDIKLAPATPQRIVAVESAPLTLPALIGTDASPLLKLKITTVGSLNPISLTGLRASLLCHDGDAQSCQVFCTGSDGRFATKSRFGSRIIASRIGQSGPETLTISGEQTLVEGDNFVWIACTLNDSANIDRSVGATCSRVSFSNGQSIALSTQSTQRMGVAVRKAGDDGIHTFRIPGLATTNRGTLIGVYDVRRRGGRDLPGDIDVGMSRSTDGGQTWEPMKVVMDMGDDPDWRYDGIGDPAVLVDRNTGTIWVAATWSHGNRSWFGSGPGINPEETGQFMLTRSDDDGITWSQPINITSQVKRPEWSFLLQGPGKGITMRDGTIVFAAQYQDPPNESDKRAHRLPHSTIIYSKDHGKTWESGTGAFDDTTEAQVVEIEPGVLMLNCRYNRQSARVVMTTRDRGKTWQKHTTSQRSLIEPGSCMASLINVDREVGKDVGNWLLFSNPDSTRGRHHITIKASPDRGLTWPKQHRLLLDEEPSAGYSCMSMIDEKTIGILYEGSQAHMTFQRIPLSDLVGRTMGFQARRMNDRDGLGRPSYEATPEVAPAKLTLPRVFGNNMVLQADSEIPVWGQARPGAEIRVTLGDRHMNSYPDVVDEATSPGSVDSSPRPLPENLPLAIDEDSQTAIADESGQWSLRLPAQRANATPTTMTIDSAGERVRFSNVLMGEVWVCAGQSNMEWPLSASDS
ncbi:MAG: exo-alpha-sialidase, partial [Planctomycetota bacterium]